MCPREGAVTILDQPQLTAWERVQLARHPQRPYTLDYVRSIFANFVELHGDRRFRDDPALVGGLAELDGRTVMIVGHQKGRDTREKVARNFGMPHPEGFRKAARLMRHAERFGFPVVSFIDTPGASPDLEAEQRGQAQAIAENLLIMATLRVPIVAIIIGEGNSGGALAIGVADRVLILEHSYFSVVSPEGCASILWRDAARAPEAAEAMRITTPHLLSLGVVDDVIPEPPGGAHTDPPAAAASTKCALDRALDELSRLSVEELLAARHEKYRAMGVYAER
ncbi:MAG: acetyl-CoA carboxylase carboxyltransferase subunit alpha [Chloroflexi bacterium]|nr:acetyl-CoA carboxylase carboxyltransferase subunit alpha [Chloroflexota bacterium]